jgi:hypothetical protein
MEGGGCLAVEENLMAYSQSLWRNTAAPIIAEVIARVGTDDPAALRRALLEAYPFGERRLHPYRIWRDEARRQLRGPSLVGTRQVPVSPGQLTFITEGVGEAETSPTTTPMGHDTAIGGEARDAPSNGNHENQH